MLIKLTGVPHPDLNGGNSQPLYIDASRVLLIARGWQQFPKIGSIDGKQELSRALYGAACRLQDHVNAYIPKMQDPVAVEWMMTARAAAMDVQNAYQKWTYGSKEQDYHPRVDCTEVQLACGTALEHGVMLTRVWVQESPEQVAAAMQRAFDEPKNWSIADPRRFRGAP